MKFFRKKDVQQNVISDFGMVQKTDIFSVVVIIFSVLMSIFLIGIAVATIAFS